MASTTTAPRRAASLPPVPDDGLLRRYAATRDARDLETLVVRFGPFAERLSRRYAGGTYPREDLEQVAHVGLVKALQRFCPERGSRFWSFAVPTIVGELRHFCRDTAWTAHVPREMQERARAVSTAREAVGARIGREATVSELAAELDWHEDQVVAGLLAMGTRTAVPFEPSSDADDEASFAVADRLGTPDPGFALVEERATLHAALPALTETERAVVRMHFADDLGHREIASRLGISEGRVPRLLETALATLRRILEARPARRADAPLRSCAA